MKCTEYFNNRIYIVISKNGGVGDEHKLFFGDFDF